MNPKCHFCGRESSVMLNTLRVNLEHYHICASCTLIATNVIDHQNFKHKPSGFFCALCHRQTSELLFQPVGELIAGRGLCLICVDRIKKGCGPKQPEYPPHVNERLIIGENAQAGLPISAPAIGVDHVNQHGVRWYHRNNHFALQENINNVWIDVPCVIHK